MHVEVILFIFGESVKSRTARLNASGTPVTENTLIDRCKKWFGNFNYTATLHFHTICCVQTIQSFLVDRTHELQIFWPFPLAREH